MAIQCLPEIEYQALNSHQISIQFKYCKMSEFETSHHLYFKESGHKTRVLCPKLAVSNSKSGQQSQAILLPKTAHFEAKWLTLLATFTLKQPVLGRELLFCGHFL